METSDALRNALFPEDGENTYAILDGAACRVLLQMLDELQPPFFCLYEGELAPDVESCAPHLVALLPEHPFTSWLLSELPGKPWGIFVRSSGTLLELRKHFRSFLIVKNEQGQNLYFRYYDPRVLRVFLPTCDTEQLTKFFGSVSAFISEAEKGGFTAYRFQDKQLRPKRIASSDTSMASATRE